MGQIPNSALPFNDAAVNGDIVTQDQWNQLVSVLQTAINDNFYRIVEQFNLLNADGSTNTSMQVTNADGTTNVVQFQMGQGVTISAMQTGGDITFAFSIANGALTNTMLGANSVGTSQIQAGAVTNTQIDSATITGEKIANQTVTGANLVDGTITNTQIASGTLDGRYYTQTQLNAGQLDTLYFTQAQVQALINSAAYSKTVQVATSFPANPNDGLQVFRSDRGLLFTYSAVIGQWTSGGNLKAVGMTSVLHPSQQTFTRSTAASRLNGQLVAPQVLRLEQGAKRGLAPFIEEATTNLVTNSGFESVTGTATVFSDTLAEHTGIATPAPWTLVSGGFTFGTNVCQCTAASSVMNAGNSWHPLVGTDGIGLNLTVQATFTQPATVGNMIIELFGNVNNRYRLATNASSVAIYKQVSGGAFVLLGTAPFTPSANQTYTLQFTITSGWTMSGYVYSGTGTGGTLIQSIINITDNSLVPYYYSIAVGGDTGVNISDASVTAPFADGWTVGGDSRVAWGLTTDSVGGTYAMSAVGVASGVSGYVHSTNNYSYASGDAYTGSAYVITTGVGSGGAYLSTNTNVGVLSSKLTGTNVATRISSTSTATASGTNTTSLWITDVGTAVFDNVQVEQKAYATTYVDGSRNADSLSYTLDKPLASRWFGAFVWKPEQSSAELQSAGHRPYFTWIGNTYNNANNESYTVYYDETVATFVFEKYDGTTYYRLSSSSVLFNAEDDVFVAVQDDVTNGNMYLWVSVNGSSIVKSSLANTVQPVPVQYVELGGSVAHGYEANGTIEATIHELAANETITDDMVQALFSASVWAGDSDYSIYASQGVVPDAYGNLVPRNPSTVAAGNTWGVVDKNGNIVLNVFTDGTGKVQGVNSNNLAQVLSGGYKIQSGQVAITISTANSYTPVTVTFPEAFLSAPYTFASYASNIVAGSDITATVNATNNTATQTTIGVVRNNTGTVYVNWFAIGN